MLDTKHCLLSLVGAIIGFSVIFLFEVDGYEWLIAWQIGVPLGIFCGVLIADLPMTGFNSYHIVGLLLSLVASKGVVYLGCVLMDTLGGMGFIITSFLSVATCLSCYHFSKVILTK